MTVQPDDILMVVILLGTPVVVFAGWHWRDSVRRRRLGEALVELGFSYTTRVDVTRVDDGTSSGPLGLLVRNSAGVKWAGWRDTEQGSAVVLEHRALKRTGHWMRTVFNTVAAVTVPTGGGRVVLHRVRFMVDVESLFRRAPTKTGDHEFDRRWRIETDSPDNALRLLSPGVRDLLKAEHRVTTVSIEGEAVSVAYPKRVGPRGVKALIDTAGALAAILRRDREPVTPSAA